MTKPSTPRAARSMAFLSRWMTHTTRDHRTPLARTARPPSGSPLPSSPHPWSPSSGAARAHAKHFPSQHIGGPVSVRERAPRSAGCLRWPLGALRPAVEVRRADDGDQVRCNDKVVIGTGGSRGIGGAIAMAATSASGVSIILPGAADRGFFDARGHGCDRQRPRPVPPEQVAAVIETVASGQQERFVPGWLRHAAVFRHLVPPLYRWGSRRAFRTQLASDRVRQ